MSEELLEFTKRDFTDILKNHYILVEGGLSFGDLSSPRNSIVSGSPAASSPMSERPPPIQVFK